MLTEKVSGFGYNGEYYDAATGMLNLRARQYEPAQARFSQRDSLKGWVTSPRSLNAYLYCQNDAINYFDASGAAMVAVNMTDGGGGRSTAMRVTDVATSIATAVKQITAATVTKEANTHALTQAQVSSILKEKNNPASVLQQARANRTKALENTSAVSGSKNTAWLAWYFDEITIKKELLLTLQDGSEKELPSNTRLINIAYSEEGNLCVVSDTDDFGRLKVKYSENGFPLLLPTEEEMDLFFNTETEQDLAHNWFY